MRIAHLTDLHYSSIKSVYDFNKLFAALLDSLAIEQAEKKIDLVFITGDLVDRGGSNLIPHDHYQMVKEIILEPIASKLGLANDKIIIMPGNHDVCETKGENNFFLKGLRTDIDIPKVNQLVDDNFRSWKNKEIDGVQKFKDFERSFYDPSIIDTKSQIEHSNFETLFILSFGKAKIGIAAFNSAWSCNTQLDKEDKFKLTFGTGQIARAEKNLRAKQTLILHSSIIPSIKVFTMSEKKKK